VPYENSAHWRNVANGVGSPFAGLVMEYRDAAGSNVDLVALKRQVEATLNGHKSQLILAGCSKAASCGCRVKVRFNVTFLLSVKNCHVGEYHKEIWLFPKTDRADAASWGESNFDPIPKDPNRYVSLSEMNIVAHECGHLFNYPD
jgi:type VI secretion system secreted protein VgrG